VVVFGRTVGVGVVNDGLVGASLSFRSSLCFSAAADAVLQQLMLFCSS
jgi:hypothetical protein